MPPNGMTEPDWRLLITRIRDRECLPFLGAGVSVNAGSSPGLPSGPDLARLLAKENEYPESDDWDLFRVCQYIETVLNDAHAPRAAIREKLRVPGAQPTVVHQLLAKLPFAYTLTTNFDNLMERALEAAGKNPYAEVYVRRANGKELSQTTDRNPLVYKLHGTLDQVETLVATEDDVIDFAACLLQDNPGLPSLIGKMFETYSLLFIGYGLRDWNVRMMMRALRKRRGPPDKVSYAIQRRPRDEPAAKVWEQSVMYWDRSERLRCFDMDAHQFLQELVGRYEATVGSGS